MNKVYKLVWSKARNMYVAVAEIAKSHTKSSKSSVIGKTLVAGVLACVISCGVIAPVMAAEVTLGNTTVKNGGNVNEVVIIGNGAKADFGYTDSSVNPSSSGVLIGAGATVISEKAPGVNNVVIGPSTGYNELARAIAYKTGSVTIGSSIRNHSIDGIAIGGSNYIDGNDAIALGKYAISSGNSSVSLGAFSVSMEKDTVSFGHLTGDPSTSANANWIFENFDGDLSASAVFNSDYFRRLINVADGKKTHDVSTVDQTGNKLALDGNKLQLNNVLGTKLTEVDLSSIAGQGKVYSAGKGIVISDADEIATKNVLMYDADANDIATLAGSKGTTLTNLKAGALSKTSKDAVIGAQLFTTNANVDGLKTDVNTNKANIASLNDSVTNALESVSTLNTLVNTVDSLKADASLNNLTNAGKQVISAAAANAVQEYMAGKNKVVAPKLMSVSLDKTIGSDNVVVYDDADATTLTLEGDVGVGTKITNMAEGEVSAASMDAINGSQLYAVQQQFDTFQSALSRNNSTIAAAQADINTLKTGYVTLNSDVNTLKTQMETGFNVTIDGAKVKTVNPDSNQVDFAVGDNVSLTPQNGSVKISATGEGEIAEGDTRLVTGDTVYQAMKDLTPSGDDAKANKDASNVADNAADWGAAIGTGVVAEGNGELVTGDAVYKEARPVDGNYVNSMMTAGENLNALDEAVKTNADDIAGMQDSLDGKADVDLGNITTDGEGVIRTIAQSSIRVVDGNLTTVTEGADGDAVTYAVDVTEGEIAEGDTGLVSGDKVYKYVKGITGGSVTLDDLKDYAKVDASNIGANGPADNDKAWGEALGTGEVAQGDTRLVTGDTVYNETRPAADGEFIKADNTAGENLSALDGKLAEVASDMDGVKADMDGKANVDASNVADHAAEWGAAIGTGVVEADNGELVTGGTVYAEVRPEADGEYVKADSTTGENLLALDTAVAAMEGTVDKVAADMDGKANKDASNVAEHTAEWGTAIGTGLVEEGNGELVTGGTVYSAIDEMTADKADADLGNITNEGETVIKNIAKDSVVVKGAGLAKVTVSEENDAKVYTVKVTADGKVEKGNTGLVNGGTVYDAVQGKADTDAGNIDAQKWADKLGTGEIAEGNTMLVNGDTVYQALQEVNGTDLIDKDDESIRIGAKDKYDGLDNVDISKSDGSPRVLRGVATDAADDTSAANVGFVKDVAGELAGQVNQGFHRLDGRINKVGANAAALANLHLFEVDAGQRWNLAAAYGGYKGEHAAAVGLFYRPSDRVMINASTTVGNESNMYGAGVSIALDKPMYQSRGELQELVKRQGDEIANLKKAVQMLTAKTSVVEGLKAGFPDVPKNHWANNAVETLHGNGMIQGYPDGEFKGDKSMTRYEYAEMLYNALREGKNIPAKVQMEYSRELREIANKDK